MDDDPTASYIYIFNLSILRPSFAKSNIWKQNHNPNQPNPFEFNPPNSNKKLRVKLSGRKWKNWVPKPEFCVILERGRPSAPSTHFWFSPFRFRFGRGFVLCCLVLVGILLSPRVSVAIPSGYYMYLIHTYADLFFVWGIRSVSVIVCIKFSVIRACPVTTDCIVTMS